MIDKLLDPNNILFWFLIISIIAIAIAIISRPFSTYIKFVYPNAKFEAIGNPYIQAKELDNLTESKNLTSFKEILNSSKDYNILGEKTENIQQSLDENFVKTIKMMKEDSSKKMNYFFDIYLQKSDISLIKSIIISKIQNQEVDEKILDEVVTDKNKTIINKLYNSDKKEIPVILKKFGFNENIIKITKMEKPDLLQLDKELNKSFINELKNIKVPYKCNQGKQRFVKILTDINNVKNVLRAKELNYEKSIFQHLFISEGLEIPLWKFKDLAESDSVSQIINNLEGTSYYEPLKNVIEDYNKERSVQVLEIALDNYYLKCIRDISNQNYTNIGPTIRYLVSKEFEIRNLKIITKGISEELNKEYIKKYLVMEDIL